MRGTLMPKACTSAGFSVAARRYEPSLVFSITNQVPTQTAAEATITQDRKSTRLNSSHLVISYAVFCLKKKKKTLNENKEIIKKLTYKAGKYTQHNSYMRHAVTSC